MKDKKITYNINSKQVNIASNNAIINATQNNEINEKDLKTIIKKIMNDLPNLEYEDSKKITNLVYMAENELVKSKPNVSKLRNYITLLAPMLTVVNGIPSLVSNLQEFLNYILLYISH